MRKIAALIVLLLLFAFAIVKARQITNKTLITPQTLSSSPAGNPNLTSRLDGYKLATQTETASKYKGKVLFVRKGDVFLANLNNGETRRLIKNARLPVWTPDNNAVLFTRMVSRNRQPLSNDMYVGDWSLLRFDIGTSKSTEIKSKSSCFPIEAVESAIDGRIAFTSAGVNGNGHVFFSLGPQEENPPAFPGIEADDWQWGPSVSDDGRKLAYFTRRGVVVCDMRNLKVIASYPMTYSGSCRTAWSPIGDWLVASDGDGRLFRLGLRGARRPLLEGLGRNSSLHPSISPKGDAVAFEKDGAIWVCPAEGGKPQLLLQDASEPAWQHAVVRVADRYLEARKKASLFVDAAGRGDWNAVRTLLDPDPSTISIGEIKSYRSTFAILPPSSRWAEEDSSVDNRNIVFIIRVSKNTYILVVTPGGINKFYEAGSI
jgi:Tol biopolymer transport system component